MTIKVTVLVFRFIRYLFRAFSGLTYPTYKLCHSRENLFHPPGGKNSTIKGRGCSPKIKKSYQDPILWAWLEYIFASKRYQFKIKNQLIFKYLPPKAPAVDLLRPLNTLSGTRTASFYRCDEHLVLPIRGSPGLLYDFRNG